MNARDPNKLTSFDLNKDSKINYDDLEVRPTKPEGKPSYLEPSFTTIEEESSEALTTLDLNGDGKITREDLELREHKPQ